MKDILLPIVGIKQKSMHCGPVCIELILKFYGYENINQTIIGKDLLVKIRRGCYPSHVINYLKRFNIVAEKTKKIEDIEKIYKGNPIIIGLRDHFMLLIGKQEDQYIYIDPATGRKNKDRLEYFKKEVIDLIVITKVGILNVRKGKKIRSK